MKASRGLLLLLLTLTFLLAMLPGLIVRAEFGVNWSATFFPSNNLTGTGVPVTGINGINFNWGQGAPIVNNVQVPGIGTDNFSARFTSTQTFTAGTYDFVVASDDGVRVFIDGAVVLDKFVNRALTTDTFSHTLTAGTHNLTVEYFDANNEAIIQVQWFVQGTSGTPGGSLFTATPAVTTVPLTASVINVKGLAVRSGPYLGGSLVTVARPGNAYGVLARNLDEGGGFTWYLLQIGDKVGWSSGRYLEFTVDPGGVPLQSTVFEQIDGAPNTGVMAAPRSIMNFRVRPSQRSASLAQIPWGAELQLLGRTIQGGQNFWFHVRYGEQVGWVFAPYVAVRGNINDVPIR